MNNPTEEDALQENRRPDQRFLQAAPSYTYAVEVRGGQPQSTRHSQGCLAATGYSPEDYAADPSLWINMVLADERDMVRQCVAKVLANEQVAPFEHRIRHKNGGIRWLRSTIVPHRDLEGRLIHYDGLVQDITDLKKAEERFRPLVESAPDALAVVDRNERIVLVNPRTEKLFGYAREELLGQRVELLVPEALRQLHVEQCQEYLVNPRPRPMAEHQNLHCRRKDGQVFPAEISLYPLEFEEGILVCAEICDITERRQWEAKVSANLRIQSILSEILQVSLHSTTLEEQLDRTLDLLLSISWITLEPKGAIFLVDESPGMLVMKAQRGLSAEVIAGCAQVPFGNCLCGRAAESRQIVAAGSTHPHHERKCEALPHSHYCVPIVSGDKTCGVIALYLDEDHLPNSEEKTFLSSVADVLSGIIKRKQAVESLRKSEERFALAARGTDAGIWDWDLRTNEVYFSPRWKSMLGYGEEEVGGNFQEWEIRLHPEDRERALGTLHDYLEGRSASYRLEHRLRHKDGTYRWIIARGAAVRSPEGTPYRMVGSHIDITEHKLAEEKVRENELQLLAAQRIQAGLLPDRPPAVAGFDIAGEAYPAEFTCGDTFDYLTLVDGSLGLVIGDVMGHGFAPSLLMASTHAYLRSLAQTTSDVGAILTLTNRILVNETKDDRFVTLLLGRLDPQARSFTYCSAGHPTGYLLDGSGRVKSYLKSTGSPLGIFRDAEFPAVGPVLLEPGDLFLLITDGVLESLSPEGKKFGDEAMLEIVRSHRHLPSRAIIENLYRAVLDFSRREKPSDDVTIVIVKVIVQEKNPREG